MNRFSGGPTSQLETIELRGFDEPTKKNISSNNKDEVILGYLGNRYRKLTAVIFVMAYVTKTSHVNNMACLFRML